MKPKKPERSEAEDLFRARLQNIIDLKHPLVRLAHETDWNFFEAAIEPLYAERGHKKCQVADSLAGIDVGRVHPDRS
jgi:hypothetical protein